MAGSTSRKGSTPSKVPFHAKQSIKRNHSILNFFQKTDGPPKSTSTQSRITQFTTKLDGRSNGRMTAGGLRRENSSNASSTSLFLEDKSGAGSNRGARNNARKNSPSEKKRSTTPDDFWGALEDVDFRDPEDERFNENGSAVKKRKVVEEEEEEESVAAGSLPSMTSGNEASGSTPVPLKKRQQSGPFIDESDSEEDLEAFRDVDGPLEVPVKADEEEEENSDPVNDVTATLRNMEEEDERKENSNSADDVTAQEHHSAVGPPALVREATSLAEHDEFANFDDIEDDEFQGEEFLDQPWGEDEKGLDDSYDSINDSPAVVGCEQSPIEKAATCPICQASLRGLSETEASVHVNDCLDGKPSTLPSTAKPEAPTKGLTRMERAAIARPAQRDPFAMKSTGATSAFSKLMTGNAEDAAWATAAAKEASSRGKQAYERTCPFYKIIPGFSVCVDAFRYGAVEGCNAYFLSHFHSDHYIGLTSSWRHGPIYCSKVTGNLVRQQLRVDPKWVVDLEWETKTEIPGTGGVQVTMIPANHCPGSSLFLFEKQMDQGHSSRLQRVLHCGDFRACPAHVQHPLLRPDSINAITGKTHQQRIDVCYLDTTYLSPKYAFPSQDDVIAACSELCVSLNEDTGDGQTLCDIGKNGKAGNIMSKFLSVVTGTESSKSKTSQPRGRLLVVMGTYSIGKERICLGIARALKCKIYATPQKKKICMCLEDPELTSLLTDDPLEAQIHMQTVFEIRAETLADYLDTMKPHFTRVVGFRPTGWTYRPPAGRMLDNPPVSTVLHSDNWKTPFTIRDMVPQRGSTRESACFGVPYSEHSSFRELTMFCCALRIGRVIPTVNVGSPKSRAKMKAWFERWEAEKKKSGLFQVSGNTW